MARSFLLSLLLLACLWAAPPVQGQSLEGLWEVTAYACPPYCGKTASGAQVGYGSIAAPSWVPFGTRLCVGDYCGVVNDRGNLHARQLDIWLPSHAAAIQWGRRWVAVTLVSPSMPWSELVEEVRYEDDGSIVLKETWLTERGQVITYTVEGGA